MNKKEAIQAMLNGKRVINKKSEKGHYFYFDDLNIHDWNGKKILWANWLNTELDEDWEIYEEPKPRKLYAYTHPSGEIRYHYYETAPFGDSGFDVALFERNKDFDIDLDKLQ